jgi:RimJ/RimL family protein N-acetyltransferase
VVSTNAAAVRLYERLGFTSYGIQPRNTKQDGVYYDQQCMQLLKTAS